MYVAGRGAVSGFGRGVAVLTEQMFAGRTAVRPRQRTASFVAPTRVAAEFPSQCLGDVDLVDLPLTAAVACAEEALAEAGAPDRAGVGVVLASTKADLSGVVGEGVGYGSPMRLAQRVAARLAIADVHAAVSCACASGIVALALATRRIAAGECERVLVVGVDVLTEFVLTGFGGIHALDPDGCRPFDAARRGVSLGDGAAALVLSAHAAESIGVRIVGHGQANDACHVTGPDYQGLGIGLAATRAIAHAGLDRTDIDLIHLHGTGTRANDTTEAIGLGNAFAGHTPPAFGTKGQTGHTLGAAGTIEALLTIAALQRGIVPANFGLREPGVDARLDLVTEPRRVERARHALKVASGFGGVQSAVVFAA